MLRVLVVLGALIAVLVGTWVHGTRAPVTRSPGTSVPTASVERVDAPINDLVPPASSEAIARPVPTRSHARRASSRNATPASLVATSPGDAPLAQASQAAPRFSAGMKIPAEDGGEPAGPAMTIEEMQALARQESEGLVTIRNPDGSETLNHEDRFREYTLLEVGADGQLEFVCVQGEAALKQALRRARPATRPAPPPATPKGDR